ncbi:hypothetical protein Tco_1410821 [Tanacetum coccineum]
MMMMMMMMVLWWWGVGRGSFGGGKWRVRESGSGDRVDPVTRSLFGLRRICPPENFSGGGARWPAVGGGGRLNWGRKGELSVAGHGGTGKGGSCVLIPDLVVMARVGDSGLRVLLLSIAERI